MLSHVLACIDNALALTEDLSSWPGGGWHGGRGVSHGVELSAFLILNPVKSQKSSIALKGECDLIIVLSRRVSKRGIGTVGILTLEFVYAPDIFQVARIVLSCRSLLSPRGEKAIVFVRGQLGPGGRRPANGENDENEYRIANCNRFVKNVRAPDSDRVPAAEGRAPAASSPHTNSGDEQRSRTLQNKFGQRDVRNFSDKFEPAKGTIKGNRSGKFYGSRVQHSSCALELLPLLRI
ncbi:hypothetical protein EVAR_57094_1 [Eumeta japonica]|uniref:Uncharacterized protein n=1 Tax=Eumeta variegata TaxID=151549 RepID=A0A4C1Z9C5_EUMVA|nr:hypothetical protein EVAR_57094_1 [Eumeta japonica]